MVLINLQGLIYHKKNLPTKNVSVKTVSIWMSHRQFIFNVFFFRLFTGP